MAESRGIVKEILDGKVVVSISKGGCHSCPLSQICRINDIEEVEAIADEPLSKGDVVVLHKSEGFLILFSFILFIVPLFVLVATYALLGGIFSQGIKILISLGVMGIYFLLLGILEKKFKERYILPHARRV